MKQWPLYLACNLSLLDNLFLKTMQLLGPSQRGTRLTVLFFLAGMGMAGVVGWKPSSTCWEQPTKPCPRHRPLSHGGTPAACPGRAPLHTPCLNLLAVDFTWRAPCKALVLPLIISIASALPARPAAPSHAPRTEPGTAAGFSPMQPAVPVQRRCPAQPHVPGSARGI